MPCLEALARLPLPRTLGLRVPEGFAYYALYPEAYLDAAAGFAREYRPGRCIVVGLRSIGTALSAVVAAELEAAGAAIESLTLRPRGAPFARRPVLEPGLADRLRHRRDAWFLIVDEGPGLSGSSFTGTAELLIGLGVPEARIALFPSWLPDGRAFVSERAREIWPRLRKFHVPFEALRHGRELMRGARDLSGGLWRALVCPDGARWPAAQPQHERRKYLHEPGPATPNPVLLKFAGLGRYGVAKRDFAELLAAGGFAPPVLGLEHGFMKTAFVPGRPLGRRDLGGALVATAARYVAFRRMNSPVAEKLRLDELLGLVENNVRWGLGADWLDRLGRLDVTPLFRDVPAVAVDARMLPHEWIRTESGFLKTDGVDHFDDHFFPGPQDVAWDVAGFAVEFGLDSRAADEFAGAVGAALRDPSLPARLPFLTLAYVATRLGYASLAASSLGATPDGRRQAKLTKRYAWQFRRAVLAWEAGV